MSLLKFYFAAIAIIAPSIAQQTSIILCDPSMCDCPAPNEIPGTLIREYNATSRSYCYCSCGKERGELCLIDDECAVGTQCAAPADYSAHPDVTMGVCRSRCSLMECPLYHKCVVTSIGQAACICDTFKCSDLLVSQLLCTVDSVSGITHYFDNSCKLTNEKCLRALEGRSSLISCTSGFV